MTAGGTDPASQTAFLDAVWRLGMQRRDVRSYGLYQELKRDFGRLFPDATVEQYELAVRVIAQASGV